MEKGGQRTEVSPRNGRVGKWNCFGLEPGGEVTVFDEGEAEGDGEKIEKCVVPREADQEHEGEESEGGGEADFGLGKQKGERE